MEPTRLFDLFISLQQEPKVDLLCTKENKVWIKHTTENVIKFINDTSAALLHLEVKKGDKIAIIANNRPEWNFVDFACQQIGAILVPIYPTISESDLLFILNDCEAKILLFSSKDILKKYNSIRPEVTSIQYLFTFNPEVEGVENYTELIKNANYSYYKNTIDSLKDIIKGDDELTILYTSGTTGRPKGVILTHANFISNIQGCQHFAPFSSTWKALSFLPLNHVYERMLIYLYLYKNISIYYAEGFETIADNLKEVQPQIFVTVPRLLERVYDKLIAAGEKLTGIKKKLFFWAHDLALNYDTKGKNGFVFELKRKVADKLIYTKWRAALGGKVVVIASGGAALQPRLARVFLCAKITILEGYGLTETAVVVAVNSMEKDSIRIGTVGRPLKNLEVKIADDGEILVKGPSIMKGYFKNKEATDEVIDEQGFFHTGDIGTFEEGIFLKITDRKKELFKTSAGKYIAPIMIENKLKECKFIEQAMVVGEGQKFASALLVPSFDNIKEYCKQNNIVFESNERINILTLIYPCFII
jgi:long-chain acyl-CoA synthetase